MQEPERLPGLHAGHRGEDVPFDILGLHVVDFDHLRLGFDVFHAAQRAHDLVTGFRVEHLQQRRTVVRLVEELDLAHEEGLHVVLDRIVDPFEETRDHEAHLLAVAHDHVDLGHVPPAELHRDVLVEEAERVALAQPHVGEARGMAQLDAAVVEETHQHGLGDVSVDRLDRQQGLNLAPRPPELDFTLEEAADLEHALHVLHVVVVDLVVAQLALDPDEHLDQETHLLPFQALLDVVFHQPGDLSDGTVFAVAQHLLQGLVEAFVNTCEKSLFPLAAVDAVDQVEGEKQVENHTQRHDGDADAHHHRIADKFIIQQVEIICQVIEPGQHFIHQYALIRLSPPHTQPRQAYNSYKVTLFSENRNSIPHFFMYYIIRNNSK